MCLSPLASADELSQTETAFVGKWAGKNANLTWEIQRNQDRTFEAVIKRAMGGKTAIHYLTGVWKVENGEHSYEALTREPNSQDFAGQFSEWVRTIEKNRIITFNPQANIKDATTQHDRLSKLTFPHWQEAARRNGQTQPANSLDDLKKRIRQAYTQMDNAARYKLIYKTGVPSVLQAVERLRIMPGHGIPGAKIVLDEIHIVEAAKTKLNYNPGQISGRPLQVHPKPSGGRLSDGRSRRVTEKFSRPITFLYARWVISSCSAGPSGAKKKTKPQVWPDYPNMTKSVSTRSSPPGTPKILPSTN